MEALTVDGQAGPATISPDGRFIAYVRRAAAQTSGVEAIELEQRRCDPASVPGIIYDAPSVTPDGGFVDVLVRGAGAGGRHIARVPFWGGTPRRLVEGAVSGIGWSADGSRMAFVKTSTVPAEPSLVIADAQGQNSRVLVTRQAPAFFVGVQFNAGNGPPARPSWSADGRWLAVAGLNTSLERSGTRGEVIEIDAATGAERAVRRVDYFATGEAAYLDNDRLIVSGAGVVRHDRLE